MCLNIYYDRINSYHINFPEAVPRTYYLPDRENLRKRDSNLTKMPEKTVLPAKRSRRANNTPLESTKQPGKRMRRVDSTSSNRMPVVVLENIFVPAKRSQRANNTSSIQAPVDKTDDTAQNLKPAGRRMRRANSTSSIAASETEEIVRQNVTKRGQGVGNPSGSTSQKHVTDGKNSQAQSLTFKSKKNVSMTISNNEVSELIKHTCEISNEKSKLQKKVVQFSEKVQKIKEEYKVEENRCDELKTMLSIKRKQCKDFQSIIDAQFCADLVQLDGMKIKNQCFI